MIGHTGGDEDGNILVLLLYSRMMDDSEAFRAFQVRGMTIC